MIDSEYIGVPFKDGGRDRKTGLDCYGLVMELIERDTGVRPPDYGAPGDLVKTQLVMLDARERWKQVAAPRRGVVVMFRVRGLICHVGYCVSETHFLHTWEGSGNALKEPIERWKQRIVGFYEYQTA